MRSSMLAGLMLLALAGCGKEEAGNAGDALAEAPPITSLDDYDLPVDKSDQITSIDAATGDAGGMPRDGGKVVELPKEEARPAGQAQEASNVTMAIPDVAAPPPPPATAPAPAPAPALTVPLGN